MIYSYPTVYAIGHAAILDLFANPVLVEEKIDGSQFSFGVIDTELQCRSKGKQIVLDAPEKMFEHATASILELAPALHPNWIYRCEYLSKPHHNTLAYDRVPPYYLILYDIATGLETYMTYEQKAAEASRLGLWCVPCLYQGMVDNVDQFNAMLENVSILGGSKIEGVVVKNYTLFTKDKKVALGKYVSEKFKEIHANEWKSSNPATKDITDLLIAKYRSPARWQKAVQHLREAGNLESSPRDIGNLIKEAQNDVKQECEEEIKDLLFAHFWSKIQRGIIAGLPEWYKEELLKSAFDTKETA